MCGNFAEVDPTQQSWTAQAEPSSLLSAIKLGRTKGWMMSKHDVKGAFLNAKIPEGKLVVVSPPGQWIEWGLVPRGTLWTLDKAVYGLRVSPRLWSDERDKQLTQVRWKVETKEYYLNRCTADSQLWRIEEVAPTDRQQKMHGIMVVYVDDFLLQSNDGPIRSGLLAALKEIWKLEEEVTSSTTQGLTFLGIDMVLRKNGDVFLHQERFVDSILEKYSYQACKGNKCDRQAAHR